MSGFRFTKMHGAGNDFVVVDDTETTREYHVTDICALCDRQRGIGADGFISLRRLSNEKIRMDFFNCDGSRANLCGNGLRCAGAFAYRTGMSQERDTIFVTDGGELSAEVIDEHNVRIYLPLTEDFREYENINGYQGYKGIVGVPHFVVPVKDVEFPDMELSGRILRFSQEFAPDGVNVDFVDISELGSDESLPVRTYERGVESETLACGTGVASVAYSLWKFCGGREKQSFLCRSGDIILVEIIINDCIVKGMYLTGPATTVFDGEWFEPFPTNNV